VSIKSKIKLYISSKISFISLPILALCWVSFFWGTTWLASKEGVKHVPALQLVAIRQFIGGSLYLLFFIYKKTAWPKGKQWKTILILSLLNFVLSNGLSTWGVKYISSGLGAIIGALFPLWIVIISYFRGVSLARLSVIGLLISFGGICLVFYDYLPDFFKPDFRFGLFLSLLSTLTWAFGTVYTRKKAASFNPYFSLGLQMFLSSILLFAFTGATGSSVSLTAIPAIAWWSIGYLVIVGSVLTFIAFIYCLQHLPVELNSIYAYINPVVALLLGALLFNEPLTIKIIFGGAITLIGLYVVNRSIKNLKFK
jgi:drug/metabolite transporter (DMT)-like permease